MLYYFCVLCNRDIDDDTMTERRRVSLDEYRALFGLPSDDVFEDLAQAWGRKKGVKDGAIHKKYTMDGGTDNFSDSIKWKIDHHHAQTEFCKQFYEGAWRDGRLWAFVRRHLDDARRKAAHVIVVKPAPDVDGPKLWYPAQRDAVHERPRVPAYIRNLFDTALETSICYATTDDESNCAENGSNGSWEEISHRDK